MLPNQLCAGLVVSMCVLLNPGANTAAAQQAVRVPVTIEPRWSTEQFQSGRAALELQLSRALDAQTERLALVIGTLDVSGLIEVRGQRVRYLPTAMRLPSGESEVTAYIVNSSGAWQEIGRLPLKVRTRTGLDQGRVLPTIDLSSTGQLDARVPDGDPAPRSAYQDLTLRLGIDGQMMRQGWQITTQANALGVTEKTQRLRWSEMQADAPAMDLSDYRIRLAQGRSHVTLGNATAGNHRYLLNNFGSRGFSAALDAGRFATIDASVLNGTNVVGWSNPFGLTEPAHRIASAGLSLELMPSRPGAIHLGISGLDGSVLPQNSINQAVVTDAEESSGFGLDVTLSDAQQRVRFSGGFARSQFDNPDDQLLARGATLVRVVRIARNARYADLGVQILGARPLTARIQTSLSAGLRHERVDPLYRSIGNSTQADVENNGLELNGSIGALSFQGTAAESRDNLGRITSILTTRTHNRGVTAATPIGALLRAAPGVWYWPSLNVAWQRVRQFGVGLPTDGDFSASHVPDQMNTNESAGLSWTRGNSNLSYRWNQSFQDNRQIGRERADFRAVVHGLTLNAMLSPRITSSLDLSNERQHNVESSATQEMKRVGFAAQLQLPHHTGLSGSLSGSWARDPASAQKTRNTEQQVELSQGFNLYRRVDNGTQGRLFLRFARARAALQPFETVSLIAPRITWTLNAGGSLRLY